MIEINNGAGKDSETAILHDELKDCNRDGVNGSVSVCGPEDMVLSGLSMMISAVANHLGCTYRDLCYAISTPIQRRKEGL